MRRRIGEWLLSAGTVALLLRGVLVIYKPVRDDVSRVPRDEIVIESFHSVVYRHRSQPERAAAVALRADAGRHSELVVFAIAAVVLFGFMLRM